MPKLLCLVATACCATAAPALAHYNMLLPAAASGKKGEVATFTYQWGHPFEHELFDAPMPESVLVRAPDGKTEDVIKTLKKVALPAGEGKTVTGYRFEFTPDQRGDYVILLKVPPIYLKEDEEFVQDTVKVIYHVQAQKGWNANVLEEFQLAPLTRPYGLEPGMVFQIETIPFPRFGVSVEVERYNATPPKVLPPDEQITRVVRCTKDGIATCTLTDAGWWSLTAMAPGRQKAMHDGKEVPLQRRTTLWVFVDEKVK